MENTEIVLGTYILFYTKSIFSCFIGTLLNPLTRN